MNSSSPKSAADSIKRVTGFFGQASLGKLFLFLIVTLVLAFSGASFFEAVLVGLNPSWQFLVALGLASFALVYFGAIFLAVALKNWYRIERLRRNTEATPDLTVSEDTDVDPRQGLVIFVSDRPHTDHISQWAEYKAIAHHQNELKYCWMVHSDAEQSQTNMKALISQFATSLEVRRKRNDNAYDVRSAFELTTDIFGEAFLLPTEPLVSRQDLIVDITGGPKPMTAGALLACIQHGVDMQYQEPQRQGDLNTTRIRRANASWFSEAAQTSTDNDPDVDSQPAA